MKNLTTAEPPLTSSSPLVFEITKRFEKLLSNYPPDTHCHPKGSSLLLIVLAEPARAR
jgi:hypothetical protein